MKLFIQDFKESKAWLERDSIVLSAPEGLPLYVLHQKDGQGALY